MEKKKMTKAEAFEYLKNKKIDASYNESEVQLKLFSLGVVWCTLDSGPTLDVKYLLIDKECHMTHCGCNLNHYKTHYYEEISADDILSIEIVEDTPKFSYEEVVELAKPLMEYLNETKCSERICVTYKSVVAEPMASLIFENDLLNL